MAKNLKKTRMSLAEAEELAQKDKRRIILMSIAAVILLGAFLFTKLNEENERLAEADNSQVPPTEVEPEVLASLPNLSPEDRKPLDNIQDETPEGRQFPDGDAIQLVLDYSNFWIAQHYEEGGTRDLTAEVLEEVAADPGAHRLLPLRGRGIVRRIIERHRDGGSYPEFHGQIELEDGAHLAFITIKSPGRSNIAEGDFVMLQGLFLQQFRFEGLDGWVEAPLLCSRELVPSFPRAELGSDLATPLLSTVRDDRIGVISDRPWDAEFELMAKALVEDDGVDWATVPVLDTESINKLLLDGEAYRGMPFRMPVSVNLEALARRVDENPLRLSRVTESWVANQSWKSDAPAIKITLPDDRPELGDRKGEAKYLEAKLYFFRNFVHETKSGQPGRTPWFVARSLTIFEPETDPWPQRIMFGMLIGTALLVLFIWGLLRRDKAQSDRLQQELIRRRRARRELQEGSLAVADGAEGEVPG